MYSVRVDSFEGSADVGVGGVDGLSPVLWWASVRASASSELEGCHTGRRARSAAR
jgi:hypothetical protein